MKQECIIFYSRGGQTGSRVKLSRSLMAYGKLTGRNLTATLIAVDENGRPYLPDLPEVFFSVSHSGDLWLASFAPFEHGLDTQFCRPANFLQLSRRFFTPVEAQAVAKSNGALFYPIWTAKESYGKMKGRGLLPYLSSFDVLDDKGEVSAAHGARWQYLSSFDGYCTCLCLPGEKEIAVRLQKLVDN